MKQGKISVIGLGAGDMEQMTVGVYRFLERAIDEKIPVYLRTKEHPLVPDLQQMGLEFVSFDTVYDQEDAFENVYEVITRTLVEEADKQQHIIYAVPGHPMVAEKVVQNLLAQNDIEVDVLGGKSFIDDLLQAVGVDIVDGFQLLDALDFSIDDVVMTQAIIVMQVFNAFVASDVKLALMEKYPDDYRVALVHRAGTKQEKVEWMPLYELDRLDDSVYNLTSVFIPPMALNESVKTWHLLQHQMDAIAQQGLWIKEQTYMSLLTHLQSEVDELKIAIEKDDIDNLIEELGDILFLVMLYNALGESDMLFNFEEVLEKLNKKITRRHPDVFSELEIHTLDELYAIWETIKKGEKDEIR